VLPLPVAGKLGIGRERLGKEPGRHRVQRLLVSPISQSQSLAVVLRRLAAKRGGQTQIECVLCGISGRQFVQLGLGHCRFVVVAERLGGPDQIR
jgi:hypothetical protein